MMAKCFMVSYDQESNSHKWNQINTISLNVIRMYTYFGKKLRFLK